LALTTGAMGNSLLGTSAGGGITSGGNNTMLGYGAGDNLTTGSRNIIMGYAVDASAIGVSDELRIGKQTTIAIGANLSTGAVTFNSAYTFPTADGNVSDMLTTDGAGNLSFAAASGGATDLDGLTDAEIGGGAAAFYNVFLSNGATASGVTQHGTIGVGTEGNIALGGDSLKVLSTGNYNIGIGTGALQTNATGSSNIAIGRFALKLITEDDSIGIGTSAGSSLTTAGYGGSVYIGTSAGALDVVGQNTYIGFQAGNASTGGWQNIALGFQADVSAGGVHRTIAIGTQQTTTQSDTLSLGGLSKTLLHGEYGTTGQAKLGINLGTTWQPPSATLHVKGAGLTVGTTSLLVEDSGGNDILKITDDKRLVYTDGNEAAGYVLTSDANGIGTWQAAGGGGATVLNDLTDVSINGTGQLWNFIKNGTTPDGAPAIGGISGAVSNLGIGGTALNSLTSGGNNTAFGNYALYSLQGGSNNIAMGYQSQFSNVSGAENITLGNSSGRNTTGSYNVSIGSSAGYSITGNGNTSVGAGAGKNITTGAYNTVLGYQTDNHLTGSASYNILIGMFCEPGTAANNSQFVLGHAHGNAHYLMSGDYSVLNQAKLGINLGGAAGNAGAANMPTATLHVKSGGLLFSDVALLITDSSDNQLMKLTSAGDNISIGKYALDAITGGSGLNNVALGVNAGTAISTGDNNTVIGERAGYALNTGTDNLISGFYAGTAITNSVGNVYLGYRAGSATAGSANGRNIAIGYYAMGSGNGDGQENVSLGHYAGSAVSSGDYNLLIGRQAGNAITTGSRNIVLGGYTGGLGVSTASYNIIIGDAAGAANADNQIAIGKSVVTTAADELNIGGNIIGSMTAADRYTTFVGQTYTTNSSGVSPNVLADGATITPDFKDGNVQTVELGGNRAIANPTNIKAGATYILIIKQDGTGSRTASWGSKYKFPGGTAPTLTTAANQADIITVVAYSASILMCTSTLNFATS
jgi:hypothetical protein